jgi:hypothetical protein
VPRHRDWVKSAIRSEAARMFAGSGRVNLSELSRRIGVNHWTVRKHVNQMREARCWIYPLDQGANSRSRRLIPGP